MLKSVIYGKATGHLLRLAVTLRALENAMKVLSFFSDPEQVSANELSQKLLEQQSLPTVSLNNVQSAAALNVYFIKNKLTLTGYAQVDDSEVNTSMSQKHFQDAKTARAFSERTILLSKGKVVFLSDLSDKNICRKEEFSSVCGNLEANKLRKLGKHYKGASRKSGVAFEKSLVTSADVGLVNAIISLGVSIDDYQAAFVAEQVDSNLKRGVSITSNMSSEEKRSREEGHD